MSGHSTYQPKNAFMQWMERRLPIAGLVYSSFIVYPTPRNLNYWWTFGGILAFMLGAQIVMGFVLPWGQMSFWAATVITNLFSAIPLVGESIVAWLWGGFAVGNPTLNRFYSLHYLLPFVI